MILLFIQYMVPSLQLGLTADSVFGIKMLVLNWKILNLWNSLSPAVVLMHGEKFLPMLLAMTGQRYIYKILLIELWNFFCVCKLQLFLWILEFFYTSSGMRIFYFFKIFIWIPLLKIFTYLPSCLKVKNILRLILFIFCFICYLNK